MAGCSQAEPTPQPSTTAAAAMQVAPRTPAADSAAILDSFAKLAHAIDLDTARFERTQKPVTLGAGTRGDATAWRAGRIWQRLHVNANGDSFRTADTYWFSNGALLGAQLELMRAGLKPAVDRVWFRDRMLYRWTDAAGRRLEPAARSTQYEVLMMRARLDSLLRVLEHDDIVRHPRR